MIPLPGVGRRPNLFGVSGRSIERAKRFIIAATLTALITGLGVGLFVNSYQHLLSESFRERSSSYAQAFADGAREWMERGDLSILREAARLLLVGSAIYVQVKSGEALLVDERTSEVDALPPAELESGRTVRDASFPDGKGYLDITIPLTSGDGSPSGYVRIGIDKSSVAAEARGVILLSAASGVGFEILLIGILGWALLGREGRQRGPEGGDPSSHIEVGPLRIDPERKEVAIGGMPIRLTPKQFSLLLLLASEPGRVFSEEEILDAVWPDSPYADSKDIKQYVYLLRRRLGEAHPEGRSLIVTVAGFGYRLVTVEEDLTGR